MDLDSADGMSDPRNFDPSDNYDFRPPPAIEPKIVADQVKAIQENLKAEKKERP